MKLVKILGLGIGALICMAGGAVISDEFKKEVVDVVNQNKSEEEKGST